jgi:molybdate transport system ATP-binding protein
VSLQADITLPERGVDLELSVGDGQTLAMLGPNGAGKSTALAAIAGLVRPDAGTIRLDGRTLSSSIPPDTWVPPHDRGVALLAQEPRLFPHLSVLDNVAFGPHSAGVPRAAARNRARRWLLQTGCLDLADRGPATLSGGQGQRVAIARALAAQPRLLLLDEPLSALDVEVAPAVRQLLRHVLAGRTTVLVTHDVLDAVLLADRVAVVEGGQVVEEGPTAQVLSRPTSTFAARIAGLNLVRGIASGSSVVSESLRIEGLADEPLTNGQEAVAVFSPNAVSVFRERPVGSPRNSLETVVTELEPHGHQVRVRTAYLSADITPAAVAELDLVPGTPVILSVKASEVAVYPA